MRLREGIGLRYEWRVCHPPPLGVDVRRYCQMKLPKDSRAGARECTAVLAWLSSLHYRPSTPPDGRHVSSAPDGPTITIRRRTLSVAASVTSPAATGSAQIVVRNVTQLVDMIDCSAGVGRARPHGMDRPQEPAAGASHSVEGNSSPLWLRSDKVLDGPGRGVRREAGVSLRRVKGTLRLKSG